MPNNIMQVVNDLSLLFLIIKLITFFTQLRDNSRFSSLLYNRLVGLKPSPKVLMFMSTKRTSGWLC